MLPVPAAGWVGVSSSAGVAAAGVCTGVEVAEAPTRGFFRGGIIAFVCQVLSRDGQMKLVKPNSNASITKSRAKVVNTFVGKV